MARSPRSRWLDEGGFTLIELLVVVGLLGVIGSATLSVILTTTETERTENELRTSMDDARLAVGRIRKEVRGAREVRTPTDGATAGTLTMWVDHNRNLLDESDEVVNYCIRPDGGGTCGDTTASLYELIRWTGTSAPSGERVLVDTIRSGDFTHDNPILRMAFEFDPRAGAGAGPLAVTAEVRIRNVE